MFISADTMAYLFSLGLKPEELTELVSRIDADQRSVTGDLAPNLVDPDSITVPRRLYRRTPRTKPYGPAVDPATYWSPEKQRAFAYAEDFVLGTPVARLPERDWWPLVREVKRRDGFICTYCGADDRYVLHCDHIVPISRGGPNLIENLTTACEYCNSAKCDRLPQEWLARTL